MGGKGSGRKKIHKNITVSPQQDWAEYCKQYYQKVIKKKQVKEKK